MHAMLAATSTSYEFGLSSPGCTDVDSTERTFIKWYKMICCRHWSFYRQLVGDYTYCCYNNDFIIFIIIILLFTDIIVIVVGPYLLNLLNIEPKTNLRQQNWWWEKYELTKRLRNFDCIIYLIDFPKLSQKDSICPPRTSSGLSLLIWNGLEYA
jgi:hypothetical protein